MTSNADITAKINKLETTLLEEIKSLRNEIESLKLKIHDLK